ncbi:2-aminoethylphosphonate aminotransferase [Rhizobium lusitanum]|uniref:2-aminoethylphosphonate--pyruvate transaminase n=1 Tax=Rhizobium lusitanum TaxID=293958 RepID=A0A7X0MF06_9HYPH|nr:2-aminoethylphosphonate--pyruvate transaminase [Rhizobium lusitanum]MBB6488482.1 2-aminoethylphosphonate-pyruvate transaminase [Rhizobium lusitanum]
MIPMRNILLTPGPATTSQRVKQAQIVSDICPREIEFGRLQEKIARRLVEVVHGENTHSAVIFAGSGTCAVEACISSLVPADGKILVSINGAYGLRILEMCHIHLGPEQVAIHETGYDRLPDLEAIAALLGKDKAITHVVAVHHETTTGVLNPIEQLSELTRRFGVTLIVDAMSSYAGIPIDLRRTPIDVLISSSNKCIQGMAGISFAICRSKLLNPPPDYRPRSLYMDLYKQYSSFHGSLQMRFTPPVQVLYALDAALDEFFEESQIKRYMRYCSCWEALVKGMDELGFGMAVPDLPQSKLLTTFLMPPALNFSFDAMHDALLSGGFTIYPGKVGQIDCFRLANIGQIEPKDIEAFLHMLREYLAESGIDLRQDMLDQNSKSAQTAQHIS